MLKLQYFGYLTQTENYEAKKKEEVEEIPAHPMNASVEVHSYELAVR